MFLSSFRTAANNQAWLMCFYHEGYSEQQTPESLLNVWPRVVRAICYPGFRGTVSPKLGEGQSLPADGAGEQVCNSLKTVNVIDIND